MAVVGNETALRHLVAFRYLAIVFTAIMLIGTLPILTGGLLMRVHLGFAIQSGAVGNRIHRQMRPP